MYVFIYGKHSFPSLVKA